ncbi:MAG: Stp1/IreP family PP2C-type Ser/Thr phosphatase [Clostridia bacterium]|nr:Stp1/IreP family PP2C-type Ser/Thr phosphatase [Clostridia bacterium]
MIGYYGKSDIGKKRSNNQDTFMITELPGEALFAVVCDGMGGANGGKEASSLAASVFTDRVVAALNGADPVKMTGADIARILSDSASAANESVYEKSLEERELSGMGTTLAAVLFCSGRAYVANVGDSRVYLADRDHIEQVTHDHSYVQYLVDMGVMTEKEAKTAPNRNIIIRAVGIEKNLETDISTVSVLKKKLKETELLICTDGLSGPLEESEIHRILIGGDSLEKQAEKLIAAANEKSGSDNITAVVIKPDV